MSRWVNLSNSIHRCSGSSRGQGTGIGFAPLKGEGSVSVVL